MIREGAVALSSSRSSPLRRNGATSWVATVTSVPVSVAV